MRLVRLLCLTFAVSVFGAAAFADAPTLHLKRVLLSLGGVGYFEFEAAVDGNVELPLPVRLDQVDDVLKSVVVFDERGSVGQITLPGRDPLAQMFKSLPFDQSALASLSNLMNVLVGAEVTATGPRTVSGRVLRVENEKVALPSNGGETVKHRVTVVASDGIKQFILEDAESVQFGDSALQNQISSALAAIARYRLQDQRTLLVSAQGAGKRLLRVGYVVSTPLWKSTYRLTVPDAGAESKGLLQGWAIVENLSGHDWKDVELVLASGNPVTFRQQLYNAYFVQRPEVPVDVLARVAPPADPGTVSRSFSGSASSAGAGAAPRPGPIAGTQQNFVSPPPPAELVAGEAQDTSTQVLFTAPRPVSVTSGDTLMLPIVNRNAPVRRVALYQPHVHAPNPFAALLLTNDSDLGLPPGVVTLYEQAKSGAAHIGDARLALTPPAAKRLITFAVDYKVQIERDTKRRIGIVQTKIAKGAMSTTRREEQTEVYRIRMPIGDSREVLVEHPRLVGWDLAAPKLDSVELAGSYYRIPFSPRAGTTTSAEVTTQKTTGDNVALSSMPRLTLLNYAQNSEIPEKIRQALQQLASMHADTERLEFEARDVGAERERITKDQERLRQNLASVPPSSDLAKRYLDQLKSQEDQLDQMRQKETDLRQRAAAARDAFSAAVAKLDI